MDFNVNSAQLYWFAPSSWSCPWKPTWFPPQYSSSIHTSLKGFLLLREVLVWSWLTVASILKYFNCQVLTYWAVFNTLCHLCCRFPLVCGKQAARIHDSWWTAGCVLLHHPATGWGFFSLPLRCFLSYDSAGLFYHFHMCIPLCPVFYWLISQTSLHSSL